MLSTRFKVTVARILSGVVVLSRRIVGRGHVVVATRRGVRWNLDLKEGIDLAVYLGLYERWFAPVASRFVRSGEVAVDVGANVGVHTLALAKMVGPHGRVIAFEPTNWAFEKLRHNLALNPDLARRVEVFQVFLNDGTEAAPDRIYSSWPVGGVGEDEIHPILMGRAMSTDGAYGASLDNVLNTLETEALDSSRISLIKIDVDGHELDVLAGASQTLSTIRPVLLLECEPSLQDDPESWAAGWVATLRTARYDLFGLDDKPIPLTAETLLAIAPRGASVDLLAKPRADANNS